MSIRNFKVTITVGELMDLLQNPKKASEIKAKIFDLLVESAPIVDTSGPLVGTQIQVGTNNSTQISKSTPVAEETTESEESFADDEFDDIYTGEDDDQEEEPPRYTNPAIDILLNKTRAATTSKFADTAPKVQTPEEEEEDDDEEEFTLRKSKPVVKPSRTIMKPSNTDDRLKAIQNKVKSQLGGFGHLMKDRED